MLFYSYFFFLRIFPEEQLVCTLRDFFLAGSETTTTTLKWSLAFLVNHQEIQAKMRAEIDDVIGSRPVSLADRDKMPISDAVLTETLRAGNIAPFALPHTASYDVTWNGYLIPKGATIWPCLDSVMNDDDMFTDPEHFKPERFLDSEGKRLGNEKSVISFSLGKPPHSASKSLAKKIYILHFPRIFRRKQNYSYLSKSFWKRNNHIFITLVFFLFPLFQGAVFAWESPWREWRCSCSWWPSYRGLNWSPRPRTEPRRSTVSSARPTLPAPTTSVPSSEPERSRNRGIQRYFGHCWIPGDIQPKLIILSVRVMYSTCTVYHMKDYIHVRVFWRFASIHVEYITYIAKDQDFVLCL